jgi:hypothetical protein
MQEPSNIREKIKAYYGEMTESHHRYRSWEHCFRYFHEATPDDVAENQDQAALQLGFYLASWGMYRGSSFLLQHDYKIHLEVIDRLVAPRLADLWRREFGADCNDSELLPLILQAIDAVRSAYRPFAATDTLVTKVLLGTFGCLPACDQLFIVGFKSEGYKYSYLNRAFIERILQFCKHHLADL